MIGRGNNILVTEGFKARICSFMDSFPLTIYGMSLLEIDERMMKRFKSSENESPSGQ